MCFSCGKVGHSATRCPQNCMDHVRGAHEVPSDVKSSSLDPFFPPWTVRSQIWADALKPCHSGVSTDVLLFSEMNLSLVHHYRVFRRGLPHFAFCKDYLTRLRVFVSQVSAMAQCALSSLVLASSGSPRNVCRCDADTGSPQKTRRVRRRMRPTRVWDDPVCVPSPMTAVTAVRDLANLSSDLPMIPLPLLPLPASSVLPPESWLTLRWTSFRHLQLRRMTCLGRAPSTRSPPPPPGATPGCPQGIQNKIP